MKRIIRSATAVVKASQYENIHDLMNDIPDGEFSRFSKAEKRLFAKAKLSKDPQVYLAGAADAIELTGASVSDAFIDFYNRVIENWKFNHGDGVMSASTAGTKLDNLDRLIDDQLYEAWDNYRELDLESAYSVVLDHVIAVITEMDDDGRYASYLPIADHNNSEFTDRVRSYVESHYSDYRWDSDYAYDC